jgi:hypothetical protein
LKSTWRRASRRSDRRQVGRHVDGELEPLTLRVRSKEGRRLAQHRADRGAGEASSRGPFEAGEFEHVVDESAQTLDSAVMCR